MPHQSSRPASLLERGPGFGWASWQVAWAGLGCPARAHRRPSQAPWTMEPAAGLPGGASLSFSGALRYSRLEKWRGSRSGWTWMEGPTKRTGREIQSNCSTPPAKLETDGGKSEREATFTFPRRAASRAHTTSSLSLLPRPPTPFRHRQPRLNGPPPVHLPVVSRPRLNWVGAFFTMLFSSSLLALLAVQVWGAVAQVR